jgi:hypothetical protein
VSVVPESDEPTVENVEFPRLEAKAAVRLTKEWSLRTFTDTPNKLVQVQTRIEDMLERAYLVERGKIEATVTRAADRAMADPSGVRHQLRRHAIAKLQEKLRVRCIVRAGEGGHVSRTGELSAIFAEMDLRDIVSIEIGNDPGEDSQAPLIKLTIGSNKSDGWFDPGVELRVAGSDRTWVGGVIDALSTELAHSKPWWSFLRSAWLCIPLGVMLGWGIAGAILAWVTKKPDSGDFLVAAILGAFGGAITSALVIAPIFARMFPAADVHDVGSQAKGRQALVVLFAGVGFLLSVAGVVLGVLAI